MPEQRKVRISVTALDRLRSDPYQFYAQAILRLRELDMLDAEPSPAWRGEAAHAVLEQWHKTGRPMAEIADEELRKMNAHPLMRAQWRVTGMPPTRKQVEQGYALQLGTIGLMAAQGAFPNLQGQPSLFEYWSLGASKDSETGFGYVQSAVKLTERQGGIAPEEFLPQARYFLEDALARWILGDEPFTARLNPDAPGYSTFDQLMRLDEWMGREE